MVNRMRGLNLQTGRERQPMGKSPSGMRMLRRRLRRWKMSKRIRSVSKLSHSCMLGQYAGHAICVSIVAFGGVRRGAHRLGSLESSRIFRGVS